MSNKTPIEWDGVVYPSHKACAKALGISMNAFYKLRRRGHTSSETIEPFEKPITYGGIEFKSQRALAEYIGRSESWVSRHREELEDGSV